MTYSEDIEKILDIEDLQAVNASIVGDNPVSIARRQLSDSRRKYWEGPEGTFHLSGAYFGCGYAEGVATVDEQTGTAQVTIDTHLRISPQNVLAVKKLCRRFNQSFKITGLYVGEDNTLRFVADTPCNLLADDNLDEFFGLGMCTVRDYANIVAQIEAGRDILAVLHSEDDDYDAEDGGESDDDESIPSLFKRLFS